MLNEVTIFKPKSSRKEATISSPVTGNIVNVLGERLGRQAANRTRKAFATMSKEGIELVQFRQGDRRIRVKQIQV